MLKKQRDSTLSKLYRIRSKVNQVIHTPSPVSTPNIKAFSKYLAIKQGFSVTNCQKLQRAITLSELYQICPKSYWVIYTHSQSVYQLSGPSSNNILDILLSRFQCKNCQKLRRAITLSKFYEICSIVNQVIYTSSSISIPNTVIKALAQIIFEKSCYQDFNLIFEKGSNSGTKNLPMKKIWISYFSIRNPYMRFQDPSMHGSKVTGGIQKYGAPMHGRTSQKQYAPPTFTKLGA